MAIQPLVALDVGSTKVACAIALPREHTAGFELLGSSVAAYPAHTEAWLSDPLMVSRVIEQALERAGAHADSSRALVSMNHPSLRSERVSVRIPLSDEPVTVRGQDVDRLQERALDQVLGIDREPLLVEPLGFAGNGFEDVRDPRGRSATRLLGTFHIVTMPLAARRALVQAVESAGLEVARLTYTLAASLAGATDANAKARRLLVIDVGGLSTDLGLFVDGTLAGLEVIPQGGVTLTEQVAKELHATMDGALTWVLQGTACRKPEVRTIIEAYRDTLAQGAQRVLSGHARPEAVLVAGRGGLMDGLVEWIEGATGIPTSLCRSARSNGLGDVVQQTGLTAAIGLLEMSTAASNGGSPRAERFVDRLIGRTRTILTEYF